MSIEPESPPWPSVRARRWLFGVFAVVWLAALTMPVPFKEPSLLGWQEPPITFAKLLHLCAYAFFTIFAASLRLPRARRWMLLVFIFGHAMLSELLQFTFHAYTGRTGKWSDVALDSVGILIGMALSWRWWR